MGRTLLLFAAAGALFMVLVAGPVCAQEPAELLEFTPTGDALFDRYARACLEQDWIGYRFDDFAEFPATLAPHVLADWEAEFGQDPRYWQLRYFCLRHRYYGDPEAHQLMTEYDGSDWGGELAEDETAESELIDNLQEWVEYYATIGRLISDPAQELRMAVDLGVADAETLLLLHRALLAEWHEELARYDPFDWEGEEQTAPEISQIELNRQYEKRELELLTRAVELGTDEAWPHYMLADYYLKYGEPELAQPLLALGNSAADNRLPVCFPMSFVLDSIDEGVVPGNAMLAGAILEAGSGDQVCYPSMHAYSAWRDRITEQRVMLNLGGRLDMTQATFTATCRRAMAGRSAPFLGCQMARGITALADSVQDSASGLSPEQNNALQVQLLLAVKFTERESMRALLVQHRAPGLVGAYLDLHGDEDDLSWLPYGPMMLCRSDMGFFEAPELPLTRSRLMEQSLYTNIPMYRFAQLYELWSGETTEFRDDSGWIFEHLLEYDYSTLETPEGWPVWNWLYSRPFHW